MTRSPEQVVQSNLDAYNARDIQGFMDELSPEISLYSFGEQQPTLIGQAAVEGFYRQLFEQSPELNSQIESRITIGNTVIDHEKITGRNGLDEVVELVLIYEVYADKINKITVVRG